MKSTLALIAIFSIPLITSLFLSGSKNFSVNGNLINSDHWLMLSCDAKPLKSVLYSKGSYSWDTKLIHHEEQDRFTLENEIRDVTSCKKSQTGITDTNGKPVETYACLDGKKNGEYTAYFPSETAAKNDDDNPKVKVKANYKNGKLDGKSVHFRNNGTICRIHNYKDGLLEGGTVSYNEAKIGTQYHTFKSGNLINESIYYTGDPDNSKRYKYEYYAVKNGKEIYTKKLVVTNDKPQLYTAQTEIQYNDDQTKKMLTFTQVTDNDEVLRHLKVASTNLKYPY